MRILHLSSEYPDELRPGTIMAIQRLVNCAEQFASNHVISLHRRAVSASQRVRRRGNHTIVCERGSWLPFRRRQFVEDATRTILSERLAEGFDLVHAHKVTTEGCIALRLRAELKLQYCVSVRATDFAMIRENPHRNAEFLRVLSEATRIAVIAPWMVSRLSSAFGKRWTTAHEDKVIVLGNVVDGELLKREQHNGRYVMPIRVIRSQLPRKNVLRTLKMVRALRDRGHDIQLDVIGGGTGMPLLKRWVSSLKLTQAVKLLGETPNSEVIKQLSYYKAVILFSYPETFGLVYLEALHAGIPLLHARNTGVDGLFPGYRIGVSAPHDSAHLMSEALLQMEAGHALHRSEVRRLQDTGELSAFGSGAFTRRLAKSLYDAPFAPVSNAGPAAVAPQPASQWEQQWS